MGYVVNIIFVESAKDLLGIEQWDLPLSTVELERWWSFPRQSTPLSLQLISRRKVGVEQLLAPGTNRKKASPQGYKGRY